VTDTIKLARTWTLGPQIGRGGFGRVFEATSDQGEQGALKLVRKEPGADRELLFVDLTGVANVVPIIDSGATDEDWVLVMPRASQSLREKLAGGVALDQDQALPILIVLAELAGKQVVHRDLKPENVLFLDGHWCLADFGIARYAEKTTAKDTWKHAWSAAYNAPERWLDKRATPAADIYSFGIMAYEILTGHRPFDGPDLREQHLTKEPPTPPLPAALASLVLECLHKPAEARPSASNLVLRIPRLAQPATGVMARLQLANQAVVVAESKTAAAESAAAEERKRRQELFTAGSASLRAIADLLATTIQEGMPVATRGGRGQELLVVEAKRVTLYIAEPKTVDRREWGNWPPPFDVVAASRILIKQPGRPQDYPGRSHSLWFCDGFEKDHYRWYEIAFWAFHTHNPFAVDPGEDSGAAIAHMGSFNVARGPNAIDQGDEERFVELWAEWFAKAILGELVSPGGMPETTGPQFRR
jgi:serine/threonine-protein kinase